MQELSFADIPDATFAPSDAKQSFQETLPIAITLEDPGQCLSGSWGQALEWPWVQAPLGACCEARGASPNLPEVVFLLDGSPNSHLPGL